jgi:hypothetical protein
MGQRLNMLTLVRSAVFGDDCCAIYRVACHRRGLRRQSGVTRETRRHRLDGLFAYLASLAISSNFTMRRLRRELANAV